MNIHRIQFCSDLPKHGRRNLPTVMQKCMRLRADHNDASVLGCFCREVANKSGLVNTIVIFYVTISHVCSTRFACNRKGHIFKSRSTCSYLYHGSHAFFCSTDHSQFTNFFLQHRGLELFNNISIDLDTVHQIRFYHLAIIGDRIIKCQCMQGTDLYRITETHCDHIHQAAVFVIERCKPRLWHIFQVDARRHIQLKSMNVFSKLFWITSKCLVSEFAHPHI